MYRQLAVITIVAAAIGGGALAMGSTARPDAPAAGRSAVQAAPARVVPAVPAIEIDPFYVPQQMNFP